MGKTRLEQMLVYNFSLTLSLICTSESRYFPLPSIHEFSKYVETTLSTFSRTVAEGSESRALIAILIQQRLRNEGQFAENDEK